MKQIYALGLKGWIELRSATKPPREHTTKTVINASVRDYWGSGRLLDDDRRDWAGFPMRYDIVKKKHTISTTNFIGGHLLKVVKSKWFADRTRIQVRQGGILPMSHEMVKKVFTEAELEKLS